MKLRIHYLNRQGEMAYQDAEFKQPTEGPSADMEPEQYEDHLARSFAEVGLKCEDEDTKRVYWVTPQCVIEVERLTDTGLEVE